MPVSASWGSGPQGLAAVYGGAPALGDPQGAEFWEGLWGFGLGHVWHQEGFSCGVLARIRASLHEANAVPNLRGRWGLAMNSYYSHARLSISVLCPSPLPG